MRTLDFAQDAFRDRPTNKTAQFYSKIAREYHSDGMIEDDTLDKILREIDAFYISRDNQ